MVLAVVSGSGCLVAGKAGAAVACHGWVLAQPAWRGAALMQAGAKPRCFKEALSKS